jgi:hypothetical protein
MMPTTRLPTFAMLALLMTLAGCGGGLVAPEGPATNAFLDQVGSRCGKLSIGSQPISFLMDMNSNDVYFVDETSKLAAGEIDRATYASDINSFYPAGDNQAALDCIFDQLGGQ